MKPLLLHSIRFEKEQLPGDSDFYEYHVLGRAELHKESAQLAIDEFKKVSVTMRALFWNEEITAPLCCNFSPGYALHVTVNGHTYDFLICYECREMEVDRDGRRFAFLSHIEKGSPSVWNDLFAMPNRPAGQ
jgi:hypothetical protein